MIAFCKKTLDEIALLLSSKIDLRNIYSASFNIFGKHTINVDSTFPNEIFMLECLISTSDVGLINETIRIPKTYTTACDDWLYPLDSIFPKNIVSLSSSISLEIRRGEKSCFKKINRYMYSEDSRADFVNIDIIRFIEDNGRTLSIILNDPKCHAGCSYVNAIEISKKYITGLYKILENRGRYDLLI
jgi:hypothetical protein